jgi:hypothetical protein
MINLEFTPEKNGIVAGAENTFEVLLRASSDQEQPNGKKQKTALEFVGSYRSLWFHEW